MIQWLKAARSQFLPISGPLLKEKADEIALRLGIVDFKASEGWLSRFKHRQYLSFKSVSGEAGTVAGTVTKNLVDGRRREILKKYKPR